MLISFLAFSEIKRFRVNITKKKKCKEKVNSTLTALIFTTSVGIRNVCGEYVIIKKKEQKNEIGGKIAILFIFIIFN